MKKLGRQPRRERKKQKNQFVNKGESIVIDFFPHGKSLSRKSSEDYNPMVVVVTVSWFQFFDVILIKGYSISVTDKILLTSKNRRILRINQIYYNQLSNSALEILPEVIKSIVSNNESRFVSFLNQAHPLTTQMHQLQLLPGIGQKRMWSILEARKKENFVSFNDFASRTGISDPLSLFCNRILLELEGSPKYRLFTKKKK